MWDSQPDQCVIPSLGLLFHGSHLISKLVGCARMTRQATLAVSVLYTTTTANIRWEGGGHTWITLWLYLEDIRLSNRFLSLWVKHSLLSPFRNSLESWKVKYLFLAHNMILQIRRKASRHIRTMSVSKSETSPCVYLHSKRFEKYITKNSPLPSPSSLSTLFFFFF